MAYFAEYKPKQKCNPSIEQNSDEIEQKKEKALEMALDTRKFEIELYWKRAAYFSTFIGLVFTSYFLVAVAEKVKSEEMRYELLLIISAIGVFSSLCWFLVNKGSKYWQENWEFHVDLLEDDVMGPLYKTTKYCNDSRKKGKWGVKFWENIRWDRISPFKSYKYSVGKIGIYLSFMIVIVWVYLFVKQICNIKGWDCMSEYIVWIVTVFLIFSIVILFRKCTSTGYNGQDKDDSSFDKREIQ